MFKFKNEKLPEAKEERAKKTLARLEKINAKLENFSKRTDIVELFGNVAIDVASPVKTSLMSRGHILDAGPVSGVVGGACAILAVPVATALVAVPTVVKDLINIRIKALQRRLSIAKNMRSFEEITKNQEKQVEYATKEYEHQKKLGVKSAIKDAQKDMEKEKHIQEVFQKATAFAKEDNKEETIKRLMNIATSHESKTGKYAIYTGIQAVSGLAMKFVADYIAITPKATPYLKAAAGVCFAAAAYESIKMAGSIAPAIKERIDARNAFRRLEEYVKER
ncbi:MAG: hypothetical protein J6Y53_06095 [Alphaproteobacteria bacterium]|nr:hypothetical protein [Alphaproteobacteria bacterium]